MCNPAGLVQAGQAIGNYFIQDYNARQQVAFQEQQSRDVAEAAQADITRQFSAISERTVARDRAAARQIMQLQREASRARGTIRSEAGASGVEGISVADTVADFTQQELLRIQMTRESRRAQRLNTENEQIAISNRAKAQIEQAAGAPVQRPNVFGALFQIASAGAQFYGDNTYIDAETGSRNWNDDIWGSGGSSGFSGPYYGSPGMDR